MSVHKPISTEHAFYLTVHPNSFIYIRVIKIHPVDMIYRVSLSEFALRHAF